MSQNLQFDVVIVGAGIAGCALACALDGSSLSVLVLEAGKEAVLPELEDSVSHFDPRVSALTLGSENFLRELNVWQSLEHLRIGPFSQMSVFDGQGRGKIDFNAQDIDECHLGHIVENGLLVATMQQRLNFSSNVKLLTGSKINSISSSEFGCRLSCEGASPILIDTKLLVGADGANSFVRKACEFKTREWDYDHHAIVCTVKTQEINHQTAWQCFTEHGPLAFLPLGLKVQPGVESDKSDEPQASHYSSIVWSVDPDYAEQLLLLDDETFMQTLAYAIEQKLGKVLEVSKRFSFPLRQRHAEQYCKKSLVLVGDAAHTIHPLAGQGINLGLKDVKVLAETLLRAQELEQDIGALSVLKRYERRRKGDNLSMMAVMEGFKRLYSRQDLLTRLVRNRGMDGVDALKPLKDKIIKQAMGV